MLDNEIIRPSIDKDNNTVTSDGIIIHNCTIDPDNNNITGYTSDNKKALYVYDKDNWFFGSDIGRYNNLISLKDRTESERNEIREKALQSYRENRENKKNFNELAKAMLEQTLTEDQIKAILGDNTSMMLDSTVGSAILGAMIQGALNGSFKCAEFIRDSAGYRPKDISSVELNANVMTDADRSLIDKALKTS